MRSIVVGFDGSSESCDALRLARMCADCMSAHLVVGAAFAPGAYPVPTDPGPVERYFADTFAKAWSELGNLDFIPRKLSQVSAAQGLNDLAEELDADMIVVGSTHRGALGRVFPGSVGQRLLNVAPVAVAVAPRGFARGEHLGIGLVGVAYDGTDESELALRQAIELAERPDAKLRLITIVPELSPSPERGPYMDVLRQHLSEVQERGLHEIGDSVDVDPVLEEGDPPRFSPDTEWTSTSS